MVHVFIYADIVLAVGDKCDETKDLSPKSGQPVIGVVRNIDLSPAP